MNQRVYSGTIWEKEVAYCRARRVGQLVFVAGTTAVNEAGEIVGGEDMGAQARFIFGKIEKALLECGAQLRDVVRTRMFVTDLSQFEGVGKAHRAAFSGIDPVATCVQITALVDPRLLIEIEVDAVIAVP